jgi:hypothetical protein
MAWCLHHQDAADDAAKNEDFERAIIRRKDDGPFCFMPV